MGWAPASSSKKSSPPLLLPAASHMLANQTPCVVLRNWIATKMALWVNFSARPHMPISRWDFTRRLGPPPWRTNWERAQVPVCVRATDANTSAGRCTQRVFCHRGGRTGLKGFSHGWTAPPSERCVLLQSQKIFCLGFTRRLYFNQTATKASLF